MSLVCPDNCQILQHEFFLQFCPCDMLQRVQLVELCGTCCRDKMFQECDVKLCQTVMNGYGNYISTGAASQIVVCPL